VCRLLHLKIISLKKPLQIGLCNKAVGLGISYLDFFLFFIGLLFLLCFFLALKQAREDAGSFPDE
ncbi:hypothetical protein ABTH90_17180, partial [Acinetobacter baumannii]